MELTQRQLAILNHVVVDGQAWADNAKEEEHVLAKIVRHEPAYDEAVAKGNYQTRKQRDEAEEQTEQERYDNVGYDVKRRREYPKMGEQLDMLWHAIDLDTLDKTSDFYNNLKAVKEKYPKGDS
jgi:hypothetical protein